MDGSGKTTTANSLLDILESRGHTVLLLDLPNRQTSAGRTTVKCLQREGKPAMAFATIFFFADILGSISRKKRSDADDVIFVRYTLSAAYLPDRFVPVAYRIISKLLPAPDVKIYKDVDVNDAFQRILKRGEHTEMFENLTELNRIRKKMISLTDDWYVINGRLTPDEVADDLIDIIDSETS